MHDTVTSVQSPLAGNAPNYETPITFILRLFGMNANPIHLQELFLYLLSCPFHNTLWQKDKQSIWPMASNTE